MPSARKKRHFHPDGTARETPRNSFMSKAIELSIENVRAGKGGPFAAIIVRAGRVIAQGTNLVTSANDPTAHAEIVAIRKACRALGRFQLQDCDIYTTCEPCAMCMGAIYWARLARVFFANKSSDAAKIGFDDSFILKQCALPRSRRAIPMIQLMREEALRAFHAWTRKKDKIPY